MDKLLNNVQFIKGVGPVRSRLLLRLGIETVFDLLWHIPRGYFNRSQVQKVAGLQPGSTVNIRGTVKSTALNRTPRGMTVFKALIQDDSGLATAVWFNQPYLAGSIHPGQELFMKARVKDGYNTRELQVIEFEIIGKDDLNCKILPVYALTEGLSQKTLRRIMLHIFDEYLPLYPEILDRSLRENYGLASIDFAFRNIHYPQSREAYYQSRKRLACEELLLFYSKLIEEREPAKPAGISHLDNTLVEQLQKNLPFALTRSQQKVLEEIFADMSSPWPMNRLLQGDVGAGKTVVAAMAIAKAVSGRQQAALMAPTEILAIQHYKAMSRFLDNTGVNVSLLTSSVSVAQRKKILAAAAEGEIDILIGTHSLIQDEVEFNRLGLAVIDEQHRFGVKQRALLGQKGKMPDILVMTATPIPRTLALTVYGDLELSVIDEIPPGRKPVKTIFLKRAARSKAYNAMRKELKHSAQAYVVCPLLEESENQDLQAAVTIYEELKKDIFPEYCVGLIHGRLKSEEKEYIMEQYKRGEIQVLVATTVVEVGVDVSNASIMVVEQAERFGLSQLHQLRGRVGRGNRQSYCFLLGDPRTEEALRRLKIMEKTTDGFKLAQEDLLIRGPGEFWGVKQHGLNQLKVADLTKDTKIMEFSRRLSRQVDFSKNNIINKYIKMKFKTTDNLAKN